MLIINSEIKSVTVYKDRAMIKRFGKINSIKGDFSFSFQNLPLRIEPNSIQVNGSNGLILKDIKFERNYIKENPESDKTNLILEKKNIEESINELTDKINQANKEKLFIDAIIKKITESSTETCNTIELDTEKWMKMVIFYRTKIESIDKEIRETNKEIEKLNEKLKLINFSLRKFDNPENKINNCVTIKVEITEEGEKEIQLNYIVYGPSWYPIYDLRVNSETKKLNLEYNAFVLQNTEEKWEDVKLLLSTAQAQIIGNQPELQPWHINFYQPPLPASVSMSTNFKKKAVRKEEHSKELMDKVIYEEDEFCPPELEGMSKNDAVVETGATSVLFNISGKTTILSTGEKYKVGIFIKEFNADFKYSSVPKLLPYSFLKTKVKNDSEYPLLSGESHIFLDGNFVANSNIQLVAPGEEFWTSLGVDEGVKIDYKLVKKYEKDEGIFSKKRKVIFEYKIEVTNNKKTEEEITIFDQIPISDNAEIIVELVEPKYKENTEEIKKDEFQKISWKYRLKSGENKIINLKYSIESPRDTIVSGL